MKRYPVLAEFVDKHTGDRHQRGATFAPKDAEQLQRLVDANCLGKEPVKVSDKPVGQMSRAELEAAAVDSFSAQLGKMSDDELRAGVERAREREGEQVDPADTARQQINEDDLFDKTAAELKTIVEAEKVDVAGLTKKADIVAAIRAARAKA